jgi:hypothetical protein
LYYYFLDRDLGFMHVRLQTCAPFTCQVYANGHDYVARQLKKKGIAFEQIDNAFVELADADAAQRMADRFVKLAWPKLLEGYVRKVNPLLQDELKGMSHYWVTDQAEYATDIRWTSKHALAGLFVSRRAGTGIRLAHVQSQENLLLSGTQVARTIRW